MLRRLRPSSLRSLQYTLDVVSKGHAAQLGSFTRQINHPPPPGRSSSSAPIPDSGWSAKEVFNLPNSLSMFRIISGPFIASWIIDGDKWPLTVTAIVVSAATDWMDGYAARHVSGKPSVLGSYLDPLADKILIGSVVGALGYTGALPLPLVGIIVGRDAVLVAGSFWARASSLGWRWPGVSEFFRIKASVKDQGRQGPDIVRPLLISKVNTGVQLGLIAVCITNQWLGWPGDNVMWVVGVVTAGTTIWSGAAYAKLAISRHGKV